MVADRLNCEMAGDLPALFRVLSIGVKSCSRKHESGNPAGFLSKVPKPPAPDADSPADTIRSLTAQVADMKSQTDQLRRENQSLLQQRNETAAYVSHQVKEDLRREALSERDSAIAQLKRVQDIAEALCLSEKTVSTHKTRLMRKLGVKNNADLIRYAVEHDLT